MACPRARDRSRSMNDRERIIRYLHSVAPGFEPEADDPTELLDSVSLLQLILHIDDELGVPLDLGSLTLDDFRSVDAIVAVVQAHRDAL